MAKIETDMLNPPIEIGADGTVIVTGPIECQYLNITAKKIIFKAPIKALKVNLKADRFTNHNNIKCESFRAVTSEYIHNRGNITASKRVVMKDKKSISKGDKPSEIVNFGKISSKKGVYINTSLFETKGEISSSKVYIEGKQYLKISGIVSARKELILCSQAEITNSSSGYVIAKSCLIKSEGEKSFLNQKKGIFLIEDELRLSLQGTAINQGTIAIKNEKLTVVAGEDFINKGTLSVSGKEAYLKAYHDFVNEGNFEIQGQFQFDVGSLYNLGTLKSKVLDGKVRSEARNQGLIYAEKMSLNGLLIENLLTGIILAGEELGLFAKVLKNTGTIEAEKKAELTALLLKNLKEGKITAVQDLKMLAKEILTNAGTISSTEKTSIESLIWLLNQGEVSSMGYLNLKSDRIDNEAIIKGNKVIAEALSTLKNEKGGVISAEHQLDLMAKWTIRNEGVLASLGTLKADVQGILENRGVISSREALSLINACLVENLSQITSNKSLNIYVKQVLTNYQNGIISAKELMTLTSQYAVLNAGHLEAESLLIEASQLLVNSHGARLVAEKDIKLSTEGFLAQNGSIRSRMASIRALNLANSGEITAEQIHINVQNIFCHYESGKILASDAVNLITGNLLFYGKLQAAGKCQFQIKQTFDYSAHSVWAAEQIKLILESGYDFTKPLTVLGNLDIISPGDIGVHTDINSHGFSVEAPNFRVDNGGVYSAGKLKALIGQILNVGKRGTLSSQDSMSLQAPKIEYQGKLETGHDLEMVAEKIDFSGKAKIVGNAKLQAPDIILHNVHDRAVFMVKGNCHFDGNAQILYVDFGVGGQFTHRGLLYIRSEAMDAAERAIEDARRKKRKAMFRNVGAVLVVAGFTFFFPPAAFAGTFGEVGAVLVHGAISGGLHSAVSGQNVFNGAVEGMLFAGLDLGMGSTLKVLVDSKTVQALMLASFHSALQTGMHGGNLAHNMLAASMGSTIGNVASQNPYLQSLVSNSIKGIIKRETPEQILFSAAANALLMAARAAGESRREHILNTKKLQAPLEPKVAKAPSAPKVPKHLKARNALKTSEVSKPPEIPQRSEDRDRELSLAHKALRQFGRLYLKGEDYMNRKLEEDPDLKRKLDVFLKCKKVSSAAASALIKGGAVIIADKLGQDRNKIYQSWDKLDQASDEVSSLVEERMDEIRRHYGINEEDEAGIKGLKQAFSFYKKGSSIIKKTGDFSDKFSHSLPEKTSKQEFPQFSLKDITKASKDTKKLSKDLIHSQKREGDDNEHETQKKGDAGPGV